MPLNCSTRRYHSDWPDVDTTTPPTTTFPLVTGHTRQPGGGNFRLDLLIVDEAHLAAPAGENYAVDSDRTQIVKHIAPYFEHR